MQEPYIGTILPWTGRLVPSNWLPCDGRPLRIAQYTKLYKVLGNRYGSDETFFNLPNLSCRFPVGAADPGIPGAQKGASSIELTQANLPAHTHAHTLAQVTLPTSLNTGKENLTGSPGGYVPNKSVLTTSPSFFKPYVPGGSADTAVGGLSVQTSMSCSTAGGTAIQTLPPYGTCLYIIAVSGQEPKST